MMARQTNMEPWGDSQQSRPTALQATQAEKIDKDRLIWDLEYRAEVSRRLKAAAPSN